MSHKRMSGTEREQLLKAAMKAQSAGDSEAAEKYLKQIPVPAGLAMEMKRAVGSEIISGLDLNYADAEEKYGPDWIDR